MLNNRFKLPITKNTILIGYFVLECRMLGLRNFTSKMQIRLRFCTTNQLNIFQKLTSFVNLDKGRKTFLTALEYLCHFAKNVTLNSRAFVEYSD